MRKKVSLLSLLLLSFFLLAGCGSLHIDLEKDGSGVFYYTINDNSYSESEVKSQADRMVKEQNKAAGENIAEVKNVRKKGENIEAIITVKKVFNGTGGDLFATVSDILAFRPDLLEDVQAVGEKDKKVDFSKDEELQGFAVVHITGLDSSLETTISVPGEVAYIAGGSLADSKNNTVQADGETLTVVYEPSGGGFVALIVISVVVLAAAIGIFLFIKKRKKISANTSKEGVVSE